MLGLDHVLFILSNYVRSKFVTWSALPLFYDFQSSQKVAISRRSDVLVLPISGVVDDSFSFNVCIEAVVGGHARGGQVARELAVEAVQDGTLRRDLGSFSAHILSARLVDDLVVAANDICNRHNQTVSYTSVLRCKELALELQVAVKKFVAKLIFSL